MVECRMVRNTLVLLVACLMPVCAHVPSSADEPAAAENEFFEKQIRPLLVEHCFKCHDDKKQEGGLQLTSRERMLTGGDAGPAIVSGKPSDSLLIKAVEYLDE